MKRLLSFVSAFVLLGATLVYGQNRESWDVRFTNGIAAQVDDHIITLEELRQEIAPLIPEIRSRSRTRYEFDRNIEIVTREILQNLVDRILIIEDFYQQGFQIPEDYLQSQYDDYIIREFSGDRSEFLEYLKIQGKSDLEFRRELKQRMIVNFMRGNMERSHNEISPQKISDYYDDNKSRFFEEEGIHLRMITITPNGYKSEDVMVSEAYSIVDKLNAGNKFEDLAKEYSQDSKRSKGGDWGWLKRNELLPEISEVAFSLQEGQFSEPIRKDDNIFILYVEETREEGIQNIEKVRGEIEQAISARLARQAAQRWLERLRKKAYVKYFIEEAEQRPMINAPVQMQLGKNGT